MGVVATTKTKSTPKVDAQSKNQTDFDPSFLVICWNDPINLMEYVTHVFQRVFGWDQAKAKQHMLEVHHQGRSVVACECLEKAEHYAHPLQKYALHATLEKADV